MYVCSKDWHGNDVAMESIDQVVILCGVFFLLGLFRIIDEILV